MSIAVLALAVTLLAGCSGSTSSSSKNGNLSGGRAVAGPAAPAGSQAAADQAVPTRSATSQEGVSPEIDPATDAQSTFAVDVDTASYTYARGQIKQSRLPAAQTVRPEEFVNYFRQNYPQPAGNGFTVTTDGSRMPSTHEAQSAGDLRIMRVGLQTKAEDPANRKAAALTFVIDVSGSMDGENKLTMVKQALHTLVDQLRNDDAVAIVTFSDEAKILQRMTPVSKKSELHTAIDKLRTEGSTNLGLGLNTGYQVARDGFSKDRSNRVVLLSDGLANQGTTDSTAILAQVKEEAGKQIALLGVGVGSEYGDALMEQLADHGDGFAVYISELEQAKKIFVTRLAANIEVKALDAKVQVTFDPATVSRYRLIGYDNRAISDNSFRDDTVDGGEVGPGHSVTAIYAVRLKSGASGRVAESRIRWQDPTTRQASEAAATVTVADLSGDFTAAAPQLQCDYAAVYFAEVLRQSRYRQEVTLASLATIADQSARRSEDSDVADLAAVIRQAAPLVR